MKRFDVVLSGLGGQGVMTIAQVLAAAASREGMPVKVFEGTGMTQRGGGVFSFLRLGDALSPRIPLDKADALVSLEVSEVISVLPYLKSGGQVWTNSEKTHGYYTKLHPELYPSQERLEARVRSKTPHIEIIPAKDLAQEAGSAQAVNMVMMGAFLAGNELFQTDSVTSAIQETNAKFAPLNLEAFWKGHRFVKKEKAA